MRSKSVLALTLLFASTWCLAQAPAVAPSGADATNPNPLPKYMTPAERLLPLPTPETSLVPPTGTIHCPAEYEPCDGLFIAWEGYTDILTQLVVGITTGDPTAQMWVVVDTASEQTSAYNTLNAAGAVMSRVHFLITTTDTVWIRDYGPRFIFQDGNRAIIDHTYNRPRPNDDAFNDFLAGAWGIPQYDIGLTHGGGNFHLFHNGDAFMTSLILTENPGKTEQQVMDLYAQYQNVNLKIFPGFPTSFDSTQHIDMWMFPAGDNKVIIGQYAQSTGQPYTITEGAVSYLTAHGYTVFRTPGWQSGGTHYTYTNAVVINNQVFISKFNVSQDATALAVFQAAFPGYSIHQIDNSSIIGAAGAMHCIVMHVPRSGPNPYVTVLAPNGAETWYVGETHNITWQATDDVAVTSVDILLSTDGGQTWPVTLATDEANDGTFAWTIPHQYSTQCRVKVIAYDGDGNTGEDASDANLTIKPPATRVHWFPLDTDPGWTTEGLWAFGTPTGAGSHAKDPTGGYTGTNVYGYNLTGDYTSNMPKRSLTTTALDCSNVTEVELRFWRRLGVEGVDQALLEVSNNGSTWTTVWTTTTTVNESTWTSQAYNVAAVADNQPTVYVRWSLGPTDGSVTYPGWNIDDIAIWGIVDTTPAVCPGDTDCDGHVSFGDIDYFVASIPDNATAWAALYAARHGGAQPPCTFANCDANGDGHVNFADIDPFVALIPSGCP